MVHRRILVPLDGSRLAERALPYSEAISLNTGGELILFTAVATSNENLDHPMRAYLDVSAKALKSKRVKTSTAIAHGNAADEILKFVDRNEIDLIIISTHGRSGIGRWLLGSTAMKLLYGTSVPVLLVKSKAPKVSKVEFKKVLVPLDGSRFSEVAIPHVRDLTVRRDKEIILIRVGEPPVLIADRSPDVKPSWEEYLASLVAEIERQGIAYLQRIEAELQPSGANVRTQSIVGEPTKNILQVAQQENVDLIAMTTHGRTGISRWVYESVATKIVEESIQPVLLIRPCKPE